MLLLLPLLPLLLPLLGRGAQAGENLQHYTFDICDLNVRCNLVHDTLVHDASAACRPRYVSWQLLLCETALDEVLAKTIRFTNRQQLQKLTLTFDTLLVALYSSERSLVTTETQLIVSNSKLNAVQDSLFSSNVFKGRTSWRLENCSLVNETLDFFSRALGSKSLDILHFQNVEWLRPLTLVGAKVNYLRIVQPSALPAGLVVSKVVANDNVEIDVASGHQDLRLFNVVARSLLLTGVRLADLTPEAAQDADLYRLSIARCQLPAAEGVDSLLRGMRNVRNRLLLDSTDLQDLPLIPLQSGATRFTTEILQVSNCRLGGANFERLRALDSSLLQLTVANTTLDELAPAVWRQVAGGQLLPQLRDVDLRGNRLRSVPPAELRLISQDQPFQVDLQGNPLHCNCSLRWLGSNRSDVEIVFRNDALRCHTPEKLHNKRVEAVFASGEFCPQQSRASKSADARMLVWALIAVASLVLLCILAACLRAKCCASGGREEVKYTLATKTKVDAENGTQAVKGDGAGDTATRPTGV